MAGVDYTKGKERPFIIVNPGGPNDDDFDKVKFEGIHPILTIGCGFSYWLSQDRKMLFFLDLGIKKTFASLNLALMF